MKVEGCDSLHVMSTKDWREETKKITVVKILHVILKNMFLSVCAKINLKTNRFKKKK